MRRLRRSRLDRIPCGLQISIGPVDDETELRYVETAEGCPNKAAVSNVSGDDFGAAWLRDGFDTLV